jgi:hypothetical protein
MTNRPKLEDFSPEFLASNIKGRKINEDTRAADDDHRRLLAVPIEDRTARIAKIANGEAVAPYVDRESIVRAAADRCHDMRAAAALHHKLEQPIKHKALGELAKTFRQEERASLKRVANGIVEALAGACEHQELRDYFISQGGLVGICLTDLEKVIGHPRDRNSDLAILLKEFVAMGVLDKMPTGLR